jgi:formate hydrogenlyase transcriptional activator
MKRPITNIAAETMTTLCQYAWPGNARELENLIERSVILSSGPNLEVPLGELKSRDNPTSIVNTLEEAERGHILRALEECNWIVGGPSGAGEAWDQTHHSSNPGCRNWVSLNQRATP